MTASLNMATSYMIAGLGWDPEIRGFMAVFVSVVVLCGSVWLLLSTNKGIRLGTLISLAGFFGWMVIMAAVWWIYGIGWVGTSPSWQFYEINVGDLEQSALDVARELPNRDELPTAYELVIASDDPVAQAEFGVVTRDTLAESEKAGLSEAEIRELVEKEQKRNEATTLSELAALSPQLLAEAETGMIDGGSDDESGVGSLNFGGWKLLSTAESGEAQASAVAMLIADPNFSFSSQSDFKILDAYSIGGKSVLAGNPTRIDRIWHQISTALTVMNPVLYGIVQVQEVIDQILVPGQAPPSPEVDPEKPVISVIMVRNLGNVRVLPALVTIGSLAIFLALCLLLHERDKLASQQRDEQP